MRICLLTLNYAPEPVGIGPYSAGVAEALAGEGHDVVVICGKPYYPHWRADPAFARPMFPVADRRLGAGALRVVRCPHYIPEHPGGLNRMAHYASFAASAALAMRREFRSNTPDLVIAIAPALCAAPLAKRLARRSGVPFWLHIQDFEADAAVATGLMDCTGVLAQAAARFEKNMLCSADYVSSISPQMCARLAAKGVAKERIGELKNWADTMNIQPLERPSAFRAEWAIKARTIALYSGNIALKQGVEIIVDAAKLLAHRRDLAFVICGNGPSRQRLELAAKGLPNLFIRDLQPADRLNELLGLADIHLLPQIAGAADLVLPSKMANMFASGRPLVATADPGSGIARAAQGCGLITPPGDSGAFAAAIAQLADSPAERGKMGRRARQTAEADWSRNAILARFCDTARMLA